MSLTKPQRAQIAVKYIAKKLNKNQQDIGAMLGYTNKSAFSAVLNGKSRYFTDTLAARIVALDPSINIEFLNGNSDELLVPGYEQPEIPEMYEPGQTVAPPVLQGLKPGSIVIPPELAQMFTDLSATIRSQQETIRILVDKHE